MTSSVTARRTLRRNTTDEKVAKIIRDNFRTATDMQMDMTMHAGKTLRERLSDDLRREAAGEAVVRGKHYYALLRNAYFKGDASDALTVKNLDEVVNPQLVVALTAAKAHIRNFTPLTDFLGAAMKLNQKNVVAHLRAIMEFRASRT